jgi:hypothetical protein
VLYFSNTPHHQNEKCQEIAPASVADRDAVICTLKDAACPIVQRLTEASLSSAMFRRVVLIALEEKDFLATALHQKGFDLRFAIEVAEGLMNNRKNPPPSCPLCRHGELKVTDE